MTEIKRDLNDHPSLAGREDDAGLSRKPYGVPMTTEQLVQFARTHRGELLGNTKSEEEIAGFERGVILGGSEDFEKVDKNGSAIVGIGRDSYQRNLRKAKENDSK